MESFSFVEMWDHMGLLARGVVIMLAVMSIYSLGVTFERLATFRGARHRSVRVVAGLSDLLRQRDVAGAIELSRSPPQPPIGRVIAAALDEYQGLDSLRAGAGSTIDPGDILEAVHRATERVKEREIADLRRGLGGLATIASAAPFIGLFGTVIGIINAFRSMAASGQGGLASVSAGIAEALVTTAFGLFVAIPAVVVYNYLTNRIEEYAVDMNEVSSEVVTFVLKDGWRGRSPSR